jgi:hypothetical protein
MNSNPNKAPSNCHLDWKENILTISGAFFSRSIEILYLEAYCRPESAQRDWSETVIPHRTQLISAAPDGRRIRLECNLQDGVVVFHEIQVRESLQAQGAIVVDFVLEAKNPTEVVSQAHWAQPCIRVGSFTGFDQSADPYEYLQNCFVFINDELTRMPIPNWATEARYTPGQVWAPRTISREDVNPRPLSRLVPSNGLIGCFSGDQAFILATAWSPYQELFQGVYQCIHSDFRIGGLLPGEVKRIHGAVYILPNDLDLLLRLYQTDFPAQAALE